jgi:hypothetical protein
MGIFILYVWHPFTWGSSNEMNKQWDRFEKTGKYRRTWEKGSSKLNLILSGGAVWTNINIFRIQNIAAFRLFQDYNLLTKVCP